VKEFNDLNKKGKMLQTYSMECEDYASDREEKDQANATHSHIGSFLKTVSIK